MDMRFRAEEPHFDYPMSVIFLGERDATLNERAPSKPFFHDPPLMQ